jgi:hypothetical protein
MSVMAEREAQTKLDGRVEMDHAVLGGARSELAGGKRARGGPNKTPSRRDPAHGPQRRAT